MLSTMRSAAITALLPFTLTSFAGCGGGGDNADAEATEEQSSDSGINTILYYPDRLVETAPESFQVRFETTKGDFIVDVTRAWAPKGADRFYNLVRNGYYDGVYEDDSVVASNTRGTVTYAKGGPNSRTTQLFINFGDNSGLDAQGFVPIGRVSEGMDVVDQIHSGYGNIEELGGTGPRAYNISAQGNAYLEENFPELDHIISATLVDPAGG